MAYHRPSHLGTRAGAPLRWAASLALLFITSAHPAQGAGIVGTGTPESCTEAALDAALAGGGLVTFDCGAGAVTITVTSDKAISTDTTIDGGSLLTISGGNSVGVFSVNAGVTFTVQNLTIAFGKNGAISNAGTLAVANSTFANNSGVVGAIGNGRILKVTNCTFSDNSAPLYSASAIYSYNDFGPVSLTVTNSTFVGNSGTAIYSGRILTVTNSTFAGNSGPAIYNSNTATVTNTIVARSTSGGNCSGSIIIDGGHNLDSDGTCGVGPATDPLLDPAGLANNGGPTQTIALQAGSPAIDAGDEQVCANLPVNGLDQRGYARPGVGHTVCSIGAYEADAGPVAACVGDCNGNGVVAINELILGVNIVLELRPVDACTAFMNSGGMVDIAQLITGVNNALDGCPAG